MALEFTVRQGNSKRGHYRFRYQLEPTGGKTALTMARGSVVGIAQQHRPHAQEGVLGEDELPVAGGLPIGPRLQGEVAHVVEAGAAADSIPR